MNYREEENGIRDIEKSSIIKTMLNNNERFQFVTLGVCLVHWKLRLNAWTCKNHGTSMCVRLTHNCWTKKKEREHWSAVQYYMYIVSNIRWCSRRQPDDGSAVWLFNAASIMQNLHISCNSKRTTARQIEKSGERTTKIGIVCPCIFTSFHSWQT